MSPDKWRNAFDRDPRLGYRGGPAPTFRKAPMTDTTDQTGPFDPSHAEYLEPGDEILHLGTVTRVDKVGALGTVRVEVDTDTGISSHLLPVGTILPVKKRSTVASIIAREALHLGSPWWQTDWENLSRSVRQGLIEKADLVVHVLTRAGYTITRDTENNPDPPLVYIEPLETSGSWDKP